ncbi:hypothetical protein FS837_001753 [Tulasnella sp. UAMH 9824]|nr:hypothetical protein FS837_001753 [Tulasnella sp. UAMH 9824]
MGLVLCLLFNIVAFTAGKGMLTTAGIPSTLCMATVGGSRFLLNLRAAYFSSTNDLGWAHTGLPRGTQYTRTEGTVGMFRAPRPDLTDHGDDGEDRGTRAIEMEDWAVIGPKDDELSSPPNIFLHPIPQSQKRHRTGSPLGSSYSDFHEARDIEALEASASDLSDPSTAHSSTRH